MTLIHVKRGMVEIKVISEISTVRITQEISHSISSNYISNSGKLEIKSLRNFQALRKIKIWKFSTENTGKSTSNI